MHSKLLVISNPSNRTFEISYMIRDFRLFIDLSKTTQNNFDIHITSRKLNVYVVVLKSPSDLKSLEFNYFISSKKLKKLEYIKINHYIFDESEKRLSVNLNVYSKFDHEVHVRNTVYPSKKEHLVEFNEFYDVKGSLFKGTLKVPYEEVSEIYSFLKSHYLSYFKEM